MQFSFSPGRLSLAVFAVIISCSLAACGGGGGKKHSNDDNYDDDDYIEIIDDNSGADLSLECSEEGEIIDDLRGNRVVLGIDALTGLSTQARLPFARKIAYGGRYGEVTLGEDNVYVYTLKPEYLGSPGNMPPSFDAIAWYDADCRIHTRPVALFSDPLLEYSWHLVNDYDDADIASGVDTNPWGAWLNGDTGRGVTVAVIDTHVDDTHPDLRPNVRGDADVGIPYDYSHGTKVAALIAAAPANAEGSRGVAYDAGLRSYEGYFMNSSMLTSLFMDAFSDAPDVRVANASFGVTVPVFEGNSALRMSLDNLQDAGVLLVKSAGNGFDGIEEYSDCQSIGVSCDFSGMDEENVHPATVVTGAVNALGGHASYSSPGANLFISAPSGDVGHPHLITADWQSSCAGNPDPEYVYASLIKGRNPFYAIPCYRYTNTFSGTSAAAPQVSGAAAAVFSANPGLSIWQARYALAASARNDTVFPAMAEDEPVTSRGLTVNQGWITNAAGWRFSAKYGFGLADVTGAAAIARNCSSDPACVRREDDPREFRSGIMYCAPAAKPDGRFASAYRCTFSGFSGEGVITSKDNYEVENVVLDMGNTVFDPDQDYANTLDCKDISFDYHSYSDARSFRALALIQVEIRSPEHTLSVLKPLYAVFEGKIPGTSWRSLTNAFRGENFTPGDSFAVNVYSECPLALPVLQNASVTVHAFKK
ncbi:MAG: S8 family serine peptidase [Succinimonas sp.]|nr:S8 family serine peptidase [Succinimonas sp.]